GTTAVFINQLREKIGVMFGSPETTTGGKALKFYSSVRLDVRRIETLKDGADAVGNRTKVKVVKNKIAPPFKLAEFDILYGEGISREGSLIDMGVDNGFVKKSGSWFTYGSDQLGQGKENARRYLKEDPAVRDEIERKILDKLNIGAGRRSRRSKRGRMTTTRRSTSCPSSSDAGAGTALATGSRGTPDGRVRGREPRPRGRRPAAAPGCGIRRGQGRSAPPEAPGPERARAPATTAHRGTRGRRRRRGRGAHPGLGTSRRRRFRGRMGAGSASSPGPVAGRTRA